MDNKETAEILNDVLETLIDSSDGYEKAADIADRDILKDFFSKRAVARRNMVTKIRDEIVQVGGTPKDDGTILAGAHRAFLSVSAAVQDNDEAAIEAVDDGEEYLREKFESALKNDDLSPSARTVLKQFEGELRADGRLVDHLEKAS